LTNTIVIPARVSGTTNSGELGGNLTDCLSIEVIHDKAMFAEVRQMLHNIQASSSCHQRAANRLIKSCQSMSSDGGSILIEHVKSLYAVRLAICETSEGEAPVPTQCRSLLTPEGLHSQDRLDSSSRRISYEAEVVSGQELAPCVKALQKNNIYWISFSNNRQQASVICQALRWHVDREELIHIYARMANATEGMAKEQAAQLARAEEISRLQEQHLEILHYNHQTSKDMLDSLMDKLGVRTEEATREIQTSLQETGADADRIKMVFV
jgi:hypothetical protein